MTPAPGKQVIEVEVEGGRKVEVSVDQLRRAAMGRQIAAMVKRLLTIHQTDRGEPVDVARNPQWGAIFLDPSPDMVIIAHAQCGKSLNGTLRMFACLELGLEFAISMPTDPKRNQYVHNRIEKTIKNTPYYASRVRTAAGSDSTREKDYVNQAGKIVTAHFISAQSQNEVISFTTDLMHIDEYDFSNRNHLRMFPSRMIRSDWRLTYKSCTPTLPGERRMVHSTIAAPDNIMTEGLSGDYHQNYSYCPRCGLWQVQGWETHYIHEEIDESGRIYKFNVRDGDWSPGSVREPRPMCNNPKCGMPFDRMGPQRWIPKYPGSLVRSYHVNRFTSSLGDPLGSMVSDYSEAINNPSAMQAFQNLGCGAPFKGGHVQFSEELFRPCAAHDPYQMLMSSQIPCTAGIDVNVPFFDVQCSRWDRSSPFPQTKVYAGKIHGRENLYRLLLSFNVRTAVMDIQPELNTAVEIRDEAWEKHGIRIILCRYSSHPINKPIIISEEGAHAGDPPKLITADKTATIDSLYQSMLNRKVRWFMNFKTAIEGAMFKEMIRPTRILEISDEGTERFSWSGKPDHQLQAANLDKIAGTWFRESATSTGVLVIRSDLSIRSGGGASRPGPDRPDRVLVRRGYR